MEVPKGQFGTVSLPTRGSAEDNGFEELDSTDDDFDDDETVMERLAALSEIFPERLRKAACFFASGSVSTLTTGFTFARSAVWVVSSSALIVLLPILFEQQRMEMEKQQQEYERNILLGGIQGGQSQPPKV